MSNKLWVIHLFQDIVLLIKESWSSSLEVLRKWMLFLLCFHTEHFLFSRTTTLNTAPLKGASNPFTDTQKHEEHISLAAIQPGLRWLTRCIRSGGHWAAGADVVSSDCGRNPEYLGRTHTDTGGGGVQAPHTHGPRDLSLWGDSANHRADILDIIKRKNSPVVKKKGFKICFEEAQL